MSQAMGTRHAGVVFFGTVFCGDWLHGSVSCQAFCSSGALLVSFSAGFRYIKRIVIRDTSLVRHLVFVGRF